VKIVSPSTAGLPSSGIHFCSCNLYLQSVLDLISLLKVDKGYETIIKVCEMVFLKEPYEEDIHLQYLEAFLN